MNDKQKGGSEHKKKPYIKPEVSQVQLRPVEAVLGSCKILGTTGPAVANCNTVTSCPIPDS
jgi:hypothetical protein